MTSRSKRASSLTPAVPDGQSFAIIFERIWDDFQTFEIYFGTEFNSVTNDTFTSCNLFIIYQLLIAKSAESLSVVY